MRTDVKITELAPGAREQGSLTGRQRVVEASRCSSDWRQWRTSAYDQQLI